MNLSLHRWLGYARWRSGQVGRWLAYRLPLPGSQRYIRRLWEQQATYIHTQWGEAEHDYALLSRLLDRYQPQALIDVGCGSGRLFKLYLQHQIPAIVGVDISAQALAIAGERFPQVTTRCERLEALDFPANAFDLAICNRVLQHIPPHAIRQVTARLCYVARAVYINELSASDDLSENYYMVRHNYSALFGAHAFTIVDEGRLGEQSYQLYAKR